MYIDEIVLGTTIRLLYKDQIFQTQVKSNRSENIHFAMLEQVRVDDQLVGFNPKETILEYDNPTGGVIRFKAEQIANINFKNVPYLIFVCNDDESLYNRRKEYRTEFSIDAEIQLGRNTRIYDGYIHDISRSGVNIKVRVIDEPKALVGNVVSISFYYEKYDRIYKINGIIRRIYSDEIFTSYGIELYDVSAMWLALVNIAERNALRVRADNKYNGKKAKDAKDAKKSDDSNNKATKAGKK